MQIQAVCRTVPAALALVLACALPAWAEDRVVIDFEDHSSPGLESFPWATLGASYAPCDVAFSPQWYAVEVAGSYPTASGDVSAVGWPLPAEISFAGSVANVSAYFSAYRPGYTFSAYAGASLLGTVELAVTTFPAATPVQYTLPFQGITRVVVDGSPLDGTYWNMDDLAFEAGQSNPACPRSCPAAPVSGCTPARSSKIAFRSSDLSYPGDALKWVWRGAAAAADFGDPSAGLQSYSFCLYGASGLLSSTKVGVGFTCDQASCWRSIGSGFKYRATGSFKSATTLLLRAGSGGGVIRLARRKHLYLPTLPLGEDASVTAQLLPAAGTRCWEAVYPAPARRNAAHALDEDRSEGTFSDAIP